MPDPKQLGLFDEPDYTVFTCYVTKTLYAEFLTAYAPFAKDFVKYDIGNFYEVECLVSDENKAELFKKRFFKY